VGLFGDSQRPERKGRNGAESLELKALRRFTPPSAAVEF
jgi:hypothetical protein